MKENVNVPKYKDFENCDPTTPIVSPFLYLALTNLVDVARHTKTDTMEGIALIHPFGSSFFVLASIRSQ